MSTATTTCIRIRWAIRRDMEDILRIEHDSFSTPWTEDNFLECLRQRDIIGMVAEVEDTTVGYMVYRMHKKRLELLNLAVAPSVRRLGVGTAMLAKLRSKLRALARKRITLYVSERNLGAQFFFRSQGFRALRVEKGRYPMSDEDAYLMVYKHTQHDSEGQE